MEIEEESVEVSKETVTRWGPQHITTIIAILSLIGTYFWTIADFRVAISDLTNKTTTLKEELMDLSKKIGSLDVDGGRKQILSDAIIKQLDDKVERNNVLLEKLVEAVLNRERLSENSQRDKYKKPY